MICYTREKKSQSLLLLDKVKPVKNALYISKFPLALHLKLLIRVKEWMQFPWPVHLNYLM